MLIPSLGARPASSPLRARRARRKPTLRTSGLAPDGPQDLHGPTDLSILHGCMMLYADQAFRCGPSFQALRDCCYRYLSLAVFLTLGIGKEKGSFDHLVNQRALLRK